MTTYVNAPTTNSPSEQLITNGATHTILFDSSGTEIEMSDEFVTIEHIPTGTTATGSVTASSWVNRRGYSGGSIIIPITDGTPAGDLGGVFQISYSDDAGVNSTPYETLATVANIGANDSQVLAVDITTLKNVNYFKVKEVMTGTLTSVTFGVTVNLERLR